MIQIYRACIAEMVQFLFPKVGYLPVSKMSPLWDIFVTETLENLLLICYPNKYVLHPNYLSYETLQKFHHTIQPQNQMRSDQEE